MTKEKLILDVKPENLVGYGSIAVAFYDKIKDNKIINETGESEDIVELYIYIRITNDKYSIVRRKAGERWATVGHDRKKVCEKKTFARAYAKYLELKNTTVGINPELAAAQAKIAELEAKFNARKTRVAKPAKIAELEKPEDK
jgi:hypothetical protein